LRPASRSRRNAKIAAVIAVAVGLGLAKWLGVFEQLGEPARLARSLVDLGAWGYVAFVLAYAALQPFGVPGTIFVVAAPLIWPWPVAFVLSMAGTMAASVVGFTFARFVARDWVSGRIPARFRQYDDALAHRGFVTVFLLRFVFWMPPLLHAFFGVSKVRGWTHFWGSLAGYLVPVFLVSFFGQRLFDVVQPLFDVVKSAPPSTWVAVGIVGAVLALSACAVRRLRAKSSAQAGALAPQGNPHGGAHEADDSVDSNASVLVVDTDARTQGEGT
jgi:uncharacterized membrane protein YdjX (TVP38/TMEM64 family)